MSTAVHIHIHANNINLCPTPQQYADETGQTVKAVIAQLDRGQLPTTYLDEDESKKKRKRYVNRLAILSKQAIDSEISISV